jgi:hypothetical protein
MVAVDRPLQFVPVYKEPPQGRANHEHLQYLLD